MRKQSGRVRKHARGTFVRALLVAAAVSLFFHPRGAAADLLGWSGTNVSGNDYLSDTWFDQTNPHYTMPTAGDSLFLNNDNTVALALPQNNFMALSSTSGDGESFNVEHGNVVK